VWGDSRAYLLEAGKLRAITEDQTWVQEVGRPLGLDETSLKSHPMRHVLTMAVSASGLRSESATYSVSLPKGTVMMLSSDGLHGIVANEEIERILLANHSTFQDKCSELISAAHAEGSPDNVTVLLIRAC